MNDSSGTTKTAGRPRDPQIADQVKTATMELLRESSYAKVSIASIATRAGVSKQTVYNRWKTKADLVLDAIFETTGREAALPADAKDQSARDQLYDFLCSIFAHLSKDGKVIRSLIAAAQEDPVFNTDFRENFVDPRDHMVIELLERAQQRGELAKGRNLTMLSAFFHGAFWYALLNDRPLTDDLAREIVDELFWT